MSRSGNGEKADDRAVNVQIDRLKGVNQHFVRRICSAGQAVSTTAGGIIAVTTLASSGAVSALSDFTPSAALFLEYRVRGMKVTWCPVWKVNAVSGAPPPMYAVAAFSSGLAGTTFQQALDSTGCKIVSGYDKFVAEATYKGNKDAQLWTPTTAAVTAAETYGLWIVSESTYAASASLAIGYFVAEYIVEFRTAQ